MTDLPRANARRGLSVLLVAAALVVVTGLVIGLLVGALPLALIAAVVAAAALVVWIRARATGLVLSGSGAVALDDGEHPRLRNLVDGLCLSTGVPPPDLYVVDDPAPNSFVAGRDARRAVLVVTTGLLDALDRIELEGVVAHQLSRIRSGDVVPATLVAVLGGVTRWFIRSPLAADRIVSADVDACQITRYPPGLIAALEKIDGCLDVTSARSSVAAHLWFVPQGTIRSDIPYPSLEERIALLREL